MDLVSPHEHKKWSVENITYGEWIRSLDPDLLTEGERTMLEEERAWEASNQETVLRLDALVGQVVTLRRQMPTVASHMLVPVARSGPRSYPAGSSFKVFARVGRCLLGRAAEGTIFLLRLEWLTIE